MGFAVLCDPKTMSRLLIGRQTPSRSPLERGRGQQMNFEKIKKSPGGDTIKKKVGVGVVLTPTPVLQENSGRERGRTQLGHLLFFLFVPLRSSCLLWLFFASVLPAGSCSGIHFTTWHPFYIFSYTESVSRMRIGVGGGVIIDRPPPTPRGVRLPRDGLRGNTHMGGCLPFTYLPLLREQDLNLQPPGYEPSALPG